MYTVVRTDTRLSVDTPFFKLDRTPAIEALIADVQTETTGAADALVNSYKFTWPTQEAFIAFIHNPDVVKHIISPRAAYNATNKIVSKFSYPAA